ncbi:hypothetical protein GGF46_002259 [Coemansia sp. RSA 552]|nr:hypothetical protein GGF46_002259 [Coemansia sp. RSA 552]
MKLQGALRWATVVAVAGLAMFDVAAGQYEPPKVTVTGTRRQQHVCTHPIYCDGPILNRVQLSGVFAKDKTFIDMPTRKPVSDVVAAFNTLPADATKEHIQQFVDDNFHPIGYDVEHAELEDWNEDPPFLRGVTDPVLRGYGMSVHNQWRGLARRRKPNVLCDGCESSLLPLNHTFLTTGDDSSREFKYWNTYYINMGLLQSGLYRTARGVLQNLLDSIATYGYVPLGGRVYFADRTELPLLAPMVKDYYDATGDLEFVVGALPLLKREWSFWDEYRSVNITYTPSSQQGLSRRQGPAIVTTKTTTVGPDLFGSASLRGVALRPERYSYDVVTAKTETEGPDLFGSVNALYAASEAGTTPSVQYANPQTATKGPDLFTSSRRRRAIDIPTSNPFAGFTRPQLEVLGSVDVNDTASVNLNSILYQVEMTIANLDMIAHGGSDTQDSYLYRSRAQTRRQMILDLAYNPYSRQFSDYRISSGTHSEVWSINSMWSIWAFADTLPAEVTQHALDNLSDLQSRYTGGMPNTLYNTSLPWDFPYVQSPLQHMAIQSAASAERSPLYQKRQARMPSVAASLAQSTFSGTFCNWYAAGGSVQGVLDPSDNALPNGAAGSDSIVGADGNPIVSPDPSVAANYAWSNGVVLQVFSQYKELIRTPLSCPNARLNLVRPTQSTAPTPVETPTRQPIETPTRQPVETPTQEPVETPTRQPVETPTQPEETFTPPEETFTPPEETFTPTPDETSTPPPASTESSTPPEPSCTVATPPSPTALPPYNPCKDALARYRPFILNKARDGYKKRAPNGYMIFRLERIRHYKGKKIPANEINRLINLSDRTSGMQLSSVRVIS